MAAKTATKQEFDAVLKTVGATLDWKADNRCLNVDAPKGKTFNANGCHCLVEQFSNEGQSWKPEAYYNVIERLSYGLSDCTDPDCDICHPLQDEA